MTAAPVRMFRLPAFSSREIILVKIISFGHFAYYLTANRTLSLRSIQIIHWTAKRRSATLIVQGNHDLPTPLKPEPPLDLQHLITFRVLANTSNFTRTAEVLGYSQSTVTMQIKGLERQLGTVLIERGRFSKSIVITQAGTRILRFADRLLALAEEARAAVQTD